MNYLPETKFQKPGYKVFEEIFFWGDSNHPFCCHDLGARTAIKKDSST
jgi:hypothetical protein